ncbi:UTRA domain-containing protein [Cypionkella sp.]|uniref:UTRA domain-containing protein n=1 Tax=Cypionkella sp. TaxID=2811411 RepID=UPI00262F7CFF|nr:UTRA domain-containing protein [Cypionkella sp.]MDB5663601.1 GntR family transcriptional regulator [Cypionkella sp.]
MAEIAKHETTTFREVMAEIVQRITEGPWGPGTLLPGEVELAEEFGCSRTTMNRALREVSELGFLDRRRKAGTRVRMAPIRQARFEMPVVRSEIEKTGAVYGYELLAREVMVAPDWLRVRMGLKTRSRVLHLVCLHFADGAAFQLEDRWINASALPQAVEQDFSSVGPNEWLVATVPFSEVEISFLAAAADGVMVAHLDHALGEPVFCVERATWWQNAAVTLVTLAHRRGYRMTTRY